ncbi:MAG: thioredoxin family protein [Candidatus Omnitrophota bacterium]
MKIEILGMGCPKCKALAANVEEAVKELGVEAEIVKVTEISQIMNYGVMMTPALVVDGEVKSAGKVLIKEEVKKILQKTEVTNGGEGKG